MLSDVQLWSPPSPVQAGLNAPYGAGYFLTDYGESLLARGSIRLNAPSGAGYFLTLNWNGSTQAYISCLNAPSGAGCFLTQEAGTYKESSV